MSKPLRWVAGLLAAAPPAFALLYIHTYGVNVAHWDHLVNAELFDRYYSGTLTAEFLLRPHLEHIKLFPRLVWLALGLQTRFDNIAEMYLQWAVMLGAAVVLYSTVRRRLTSDGTPSIALFIPVLLLMFSPRQHEALLVGDGLIAYLTVTAGMIAIALLERPAVVSVALAAAAAFVASFSHFSGFLFWPIGLAILVAGGAAKRKREIVLWVAVAIAAIVLYILHWPDTAKTSLALTSADVGRAIAYAIAAAGTPFAQQPAIQLAFGAVAIAIQAAAFMWALQARRRGERLPFAVALIVFAWGVQLLIAAGRVAGDVGAGVPSRYAVFIGLGMAGAYLTLLELQSRLAARVALLVILAGTASGYTEGLRSGPLERSARLQAAQALRAEPLLTDEAIEHLLFPFAEPGRRYAAILRNRGLNVFASPPPDPSALRAGSVAAMFALEQVNFRPVDAKAPVVLEAGRTIAMSGWAYDQQNWKAFSDGYARIAPSNRLVPLAYGLNRPDVVAVFHLRRGTAAGFSVTFSSDILAPGENTVTFEFIAATGDRVVRTPSALRLERR